MVIKIETYKWPRYREWDFEILSPKWNIYFAPILSKFRDHCGRRDGIIVRPRVIVVVAVITITTTKKLSSGHSKAFAYMNSQNCDILHGSCENSSQTNPRKSSGIGYNAQLLVKKILAFNSFWEKDTQISLRVYHLAHWKCFCRRPHMNSIPNI